VHLDGNWLVFDLAPAESDALAALLLDRAWPDWRECITD